MMEDQGNIRVGKAMVATTSPSHVRGIREGNAKGNFGSQEGYKADGTSTAARSTGINADKREPIDPRMPNLSPA